MRSLVSNIMGYLDDDMAGRLYSCLPLIISDALLLASVYSIKLYESIHPSPFLVAHKQQRIKLDNKRLCSKIKERPYMAIFFKNTSNEVQNTRKNFEISD